MKITRKLLLIGFTALLGITAISVLAKDKETDEDSDAKVTGSIRVEGKHKRVELVALAKISFDDALKAAEAKVPGTVIKAELEASAAAPHGPSGPIYPGT